jgi:hypothetical protein
MLGPVVRIDTEQKLPIVRVEKGLSAQGRRMRPNSQAVAEGIDVRPVKLPHVLIGDGHLAADDPCWAQARVSQAKSRGAADRESGRQPQ